MMRFALNIKKKTNKTSGQDNVLLNVHDLNGILPVMVPRGATGLPCAGGEYGGGSVLCKSTRLFPIFDLTKYIKIMKLMKHYIGFST